MSKWIEFRISDEGVRLVRVDMIEAVVSVPHDEWETEEEPETIIELPEENITVFCVYSRVIELLKSCDNAIYVA